MSVCNLSFGPTAIIAVSDTLVYCDREPAALMGPKVETRPWASFATGYRGLSYIGDALDRMVFSGAVDTFAEADALLASLPPADGTDERATPYEMTLFGWDGDAGRLRAVRHRWNCGDGLRRIELQYGVHVNPGSAKVDDALRRAGITEADEGRMIRLSLNQHRANVDHAEGRYCIGGVGHVTTVTEAGVSQRIAFLYPGYDELAARFGDPLADEVDAFRAAHELVAA